MKKGIKVYRGIFFSDRIIGENFDFFKEYDICNVVNCCYDIENHFEGKKLKVGNEVKIIKYLNSPILDSENSNIKKLFSGVNEFIKTAKKRKRNTLVYCETGRCRSVTFIIAFAMTHGKMTLKKCYNHIVKVSNKVNHGVLISDGLKRQLMQFELELYPRMKKNSLDFFEKKRIRKNYDEKILADMYEQQELKLFEKLKEEEERGKEEEENLLEEEEIKKNEKEEEEEDFIIEQEQTNLEDDDDDDDEIKFAPNIEEGDLDDEEEVEFSSHESESEDEDEEERKKETEIHKEKEFSDESEVSKNPVENTLEILEKIGHQEKREIDDSILGKRKVEEITNFEKTGEEAKLIEPPVKKRKVENM